MDKINLLTYRFDTFALNVKYSHEQLLAAEFCALDQGIGVSQADDLNNQLSREIIAQLDAYRANPRFKFDLPLLIKGSEHQQKIWQIMRQIPSGETLTYGEVAEQISSAPRAVGGACGKNPFPIIIPCHRIIAANHQLGGFNSGHIFFNLGIKKWLLAHEGIML
ncbi:MAG: methylated-DNA--[protein]-cysteine S-methyltransferase [Burkholderiales bacterium]|nr:methylated-DNA--[protein]-cysteine S-methyltransferase [Burkholderiales bacterium]